MDLTLHRPQASCARTGRPFAAGETFYSALVRGQATIERVDCCAAAWEGPPERTLAWWRSVFPEPRTAGETLAPADVLLDVLEELEGRPDDEVLRYLLALELVRRRTLRFVDGPPERRDPAELVLACRKRDREYRVRVAAAAAADAAVEQRLTALLWSGAAA